MSVAFKEGVKIAPALVDNMIMASNQDVRQVSSDPYRFPVRVKSS